MVVVNFRIDSFDSAAPDVGKVVHDIVRVTEEAVCVAAVAADKNGNVVAVVDNNVGFVADFLPTVVYNQSYRLGQ